MFLLTSTASMLEIKLLTFCSYSLRYIITIEFPLSALVIKALFFCNFSLICIRILNSPFPFMEAPNNKEPD